MRRLGAIIQWDIVKNGEVAKSWSECKKLAIVVR